MNFFTAVSILSVISLPFTGFAGRVAAEYESKILWYNEVKIDADELWRFRDVDMPPDYSIYLEAQIIRDRLKEIIIEHALRAYHIQHPPNKDVNARMALRLQEYYGTSKFTDEHAERQNEIMSDMLRLIATWQLDPSHGDQLYLDDYSDRMSLQYWEQIKREYADTEALERLKERVPHVSADAVNEYIKAAVIKEILVERLQESLAKDQVISGSYSFEEWLYDELRLAYIDEQYRPYVLPDHNRKERHKRNLYVPSDSTSPPSLPEARGVEE